MSANFSWRNHFRNILIIGSFAALAGCLPSGVADVADGNPSAGDTPAGVSDQRISGSVGDGPVVAASIAIFSTGGIDLGTTSSGSAANFDVTVETQVPDYPLHIESSGGTDLVTSSTPDFVLRSAVIDSASSTVANLNPFTTIAIESARDMSGGVSGDNIIAALDTVSRELNSGLTTLTGVAAMENAVDAGNIAELMRASEALGEVVRRTRDKLASAGRTLSGDDIVAAIGSDLVDGVLDGRGGPRSDPRIAAIAGVTLAQVSLETMQNQLQVQGSDAMIRIENATSQVFAGTPIPSISELQATPEMIDAARTGVLAANVLLASPDLAALLAEIDTLAGGMSVLQLRQRLASNPGNAFVNALSAIANASQSELAQVTRVLRDGSSEPQNSAPQISGTPLTRIAVSEAYSFTPTATDADGDSLSFAVSGQPSWAGFDSVTGTLSGTPSASDAGSSQGIVISVTDGQASAAMASFTITVSNEVTNEPPAISGNPATSVASGEVYSFIPTANDADGDTLTFSVQNLPNWANFNSQTGELSGTPDNGDAGNWNGILISVTDGASNVSLPGFSVTVTPSSSPNQAPVISGSAGSSAQPGSVYSFQPTASDPDGDALTFSISGKPSWATFRNSDGRLQGTPAGSDAGTYGGIVITASDGQASASLPSFSIVVADPPNTPPEIFGNPTSSVSVGSAYQFAPTANDADGDSLTFSVAGLPSWAAFNSGNGSISGTPTAQFAGRYSGISITVSDGTDSASLGPFSIDVNSVALGSATLTWSPPTENTDGSSLNDLSGYRIYWGTAPGVYSNSVTIDNAGITTYVVDNLAPGTYEFVTTALNAAGAESNHSSPATKTIN